MQFENFSFGSLMIDGNTYENDVVIDRGEIRKRKKKPSKRFRDDFGHTRTRACEDSGFGCGSSLLIHKRIKSKSPITILTWRAWCHAQPSGSSRIG